MEIKTRSVKQKLTSTKLWVAIAGIASGVGVAVGGNVTEGVILIVTSVLGYLAAEGWIDAKSASVITQVVDTVGDVIDKNETE